MANTTNTTSYLDPPSLIGRQNNDGTISLTPLELKRLNDFNYAIAKMVQGGLNLANLNTDTNQAFTDIEGNVTTLQTTAAGLQSSVADAEGKATTALQTADGVKVEVDGLKSRNTVTIDSTGLYVTNAAGQTTKLSGNHITSGTIEGVTLISKSGDSAITITDGAIKLQYGSGSTIISQGVSGASIRSDSFFGGGLSIKMNSVNLSGPVNLFGSLSAGDTHVGGDLTVAQNINSSGAMKLSAGGNASFDAGGTLYLQTNGGDINIGNGGNIRLNGNVTVNGSPLTTGSGS